MLLRSAGVRGGLVVGVVLASVSTLLPHPVAPSFAAAPVPSPSELLASHPMGFVENAGQWREGVEYVSRMHGGTVTLFRDAFHVHWLGEPSQGESTSANVRLEFGNGGASGLVAEQPFRGRHSFLLGNDSSRWADARLCGRVRYLEPWPGTDLLAYERDGHFEYDLELQPGASLRQIEFTVQGGEVHLDDDGALVIETTAGPLRQPRPKTWETDADGTTTPVAAAYELRGSNRFGFTAEWSGVRPLVVDPGLLWSTFLGGTAADEVFALAVDANGVVTVVGRASSTGLPLVNAFDSTLAGGMEAFVARFDPRLPPAQQLLYCTFLGGSGYEYATAVAVDAAGVISVAGHTTSVNFPMAGNPFDASHNGVLDAFVCRLDPAQVGAAQLRMATFLGGAGDDRVHALALSGNRIMVVGQTASPTFPARNGPDLSLGGPTDAYAAVLDPAIGGVGQLIACTFLGGPQDEVASSIAVAGQSIWVAGSTNSATGFPVLNGFDGSANGDHDAFVVRYDVGPVAMTLGYATLFGGAGYDSANGITVASGGVVTIAGGSESANLPMVQAMDSSANGGRDAFVARLSTTSVGAAQLTWSTYAGGTRDDESTGVATDSAGIVYLSGYTESADLPVTPTALLPTMSGGSDGFVMRLRAGSSRFHYSSFVGGNNYDRLQAIAVDSQAIVTVGGWSMSSDYPANGYDVVYNGHADAVITRAKCCPALVVSVGNGCAGTLGVPQQVVNPIGPGQQLVSTVTTTPSTLAMLVLGFSNTSSNSVPLPYDLGPLGAPGCTFYVSVDYTKFCFGFPTATAVVDWPSSKLCDHVYSQWLVFDTSNQFGAVVSNAVEVRVGN